MKKKILKKIHIHIQKKNIKIYISNWVILKHKTLFTLKLGK